MTMSNTRAVAFLVLGLFIGQSVAMDLQTARPDWMRWDSQASLTATCSDGVCAQGKWSAFYGNKNESECQEVCDASRRLAVVPDGVKEEVYKFRQNGHFHDLAGMATEISRNVPKIDYRSNGGYWDDSFQKIGLRDHFYVRWSGYIEITAAGEYEFCTESDDGSRMNIGTTQVVNNPGWHGMRTKCGKHTLTAGKNAFWAEMFEGGGGAGMKFFYKGPDSNGQKVIVPSAVLSSTDGAGVQLNLKLPGSAALDGMCNAYSHKGSSCFTYTECQGVSASADNICADESTDFVGDLTGFKTCTYVAHLPKTTTTTTTLPPKYKETRFGKKDCAVGYSTITAEAKCRAAGTAMGKRWNGANNWGNIQAGCFSHSNNNIWFNKQQNGRTNGAFSSVCEMDV